MSSSRTIPLVSLFSPALSPQDELRGLGLSTLQLVGYWCCSRAWLEGLAGEPTRGYTQAESQVGGTRVWGVVQGRRGRARWDKCAQVCGAGACRMHVAFCPHCTITAIAPAPPCRPLCH